MKFTAPRDVWDWIVCFSPAIMNVCAVFFGPHIQFALFGNNYDEAAAWAWAGWGIWSLMLGAVLCLGLGGWLARRSDSKRGLAAGVVVGGIALMVVNAAIAFGGCAVADLAGFQP